MIETKIRIRRMIVWLFYRIAQLLTGPFGWRKDVSLDSIDPDNILVIELLNIGDTIIRFPVFHILSETYPNALTSGVFKKEIAPVLTNRKVVKKKYILQSGKGLKGFIEAYKLGLLLRKDGYTVAVVLDYTLISQLIAITSRSKVRIGYNYRGRNLFLNRPVLAPDYLNQPVGKYRPGQKIIPEYLHWQKLLKLSGLVDEQEPTVPLIKTTDDEKRIAKNIFKTIRVNPKKKIIGINPAARHASYQWPPERFGKLINRLSKDGRGIVILGGPDDIGLAEEVSKLSKVSPPVLAGKVNLSDLAGILGSLSLLISVDTGTVHLAAALGVPVIVIFGPGDPRIWAPAGSGHQVLQSKDNCYGCKQPNCYQKTHICLEKIKVDDVYQAIQETGVFK